MKIIPILNYKTPWEYVWCCAIWYYLYFAKIDTPPWVFFMFEISRKKIGKTCIQRLQHYLYNFHNYEKHLVSLCENISWWIKYWGEYCIFKWKCGLILSKQVWELFDSQQPLNVQSSIINQTQLSNTTGNLV